MSCVCENPVGITFHGDDDETGVFLVQTIAKAGMILESHEHDHGHLSYLVSGEAEVTIDGDTQIMRGPIPIIVPKNTKHKVQAKTDIVWLCITNADDLLQKERAYASLKLLEGV